jgi:succinate-semialdehyde dehydrogenase/glutarate-semialdehyde dehydrogenase
MLIARNPATEDVIEEVEPLSPHRQEEVLRNAEEAFQSWRFIAIEERARLMRALAAHMRKHQQRFAELITEDMGMPIAQSQGEIEKVAWEADYYAEHTAQFLAEEEREIGARSSYVRFDPVGVVLSIAPWNFPFYLAVRAAIPALMAGNTVLLKHASNMPRVARVLERAFEAAGFPHGVLQNLAITTEDVEAVIRDDRVARVSIIGSERAGASVATTAGAEIKPQVLELGGSDPFVVLQDADVQAAAQNAAKSRLRNCGQSCNAAKRFIVEESVIDSFLREFQKEVEKTALNDPFNPQTDLGPLATYGGLQDVERQVNESVNMGAQVVIGGQRAARKGWFYQPTVLTGITSTMPVWTEEVFGPVAPVMVVKGTEEAIHQANNTRYGLGASVWTQSDEKAEEIIPLLEAGNVSVNAPVRSHPHMPYGGIKKSGYGREFSEYGIREFVNIKSVVFK